MYSNGSLYSWSIALGFSLSNLDLALSHASVNFFILITIYSNNSFSVLIYITLPKNHFTI